MGLGTHKEFALSETCYVKKLPRRFSSKKPRKVNSSSFNIQNFNFGLNACLVVHSVGRSGGLVLMWKDELICEILCYSAFVMHCCFTDPSEASSYWLFTGVYDYPEVERKGNF